MGASFVTDSYWYWLSYYIGTRPGSELERIARWHMAALKAGAK